MIIKKIARHDILQMIITSKDLVPNDLNTDLLNLYRGKNICVPVLAGWAIHSHGLVAENRSMTS